VRDSNIENGFNLSDRLRSFRYAFDGICALIKTQHNAWIHAIATVLVIALGLVLNVSVSDWCWLVLAIVVVWVAEALNSAFELLCDIASPEFSPLVKQAKDIAAAAVLIAAVGSVAIALLVFGPYLLNESR
jgi:diacylglycerol kinase (ATP)